MKRFSEAFVKRLESTDVTRIQWIALYHLKVKGKISQRNLSVLMNVKDSSAGRLIDRMERDGLIYREKSTNDRRVILVELTEKGDQLITKLMPYGVAFNDDLIRGISQEDLDVYQKVLEKMLENIKK